MAIVRKSLLGLVAACVAQGVAVAQNDNPYKEAYTQIALNKPEAALEILKAYLAKSPSDTEALKIYTQVQQDVVEELLMQKGEVGKIVRHLLQLAQKERVAGSRDEDAIKALVAKITDKDFGVRASAMTELAHKHGEFAVPALLGLIGDADNDEGQLQGIICLQRIGGQATLPLVEALASDNAVLRRNAAAALGHIADHRAVPGLSVLLSDKNAGVRDVAAAGLKRMGVASNASPVNLHLAQAKDYLLGRVTLGADFSDVVWSFKGGKLSHTDCKADVYPFELAKKSAEKAMALDPSNAEAASLIARSYLGQVAAIENNKLEELNEVKVGLNMVAMAMGPKVLGKALTDSIADNQPSMAVAAIRALGGASDKDNLGDSPLLAMLDHKSKIIRYAAALAVSQASRANNVPMAKKVVAVLGDAVGEQALKRIATVGLDPASRSAAEATASKKGGRWIESGLNNVQQAVNSLLRGISSPDVVVVNEVISDGIPETLIGLLAKNSATENIKVIIVAKDVEKAAERFGDRIAGVIPAGFKPADLQAKVEECLKDVDLGANNARAAAVAVDAAVALNELAQRRVAIDDALSSLAAELGRADSVAIPAANALGEGGSSITALLAAIQSGDSSVDLKVACASAAGKILGRVGNIADSEFDALLAIATKADNDARLRTAAVTALGKAKLIPGQQLKMVQALSTAAVVGN